MANRIDKMGDRTPAVRRFSRLFTVAFAFTTWAAHAPAAPQSCDVVLKERFAVKGSVSGDLEDAAVVRDLRGSQADNVIRVLDAASGSERFALRGYTYAGTQAGYLYATGYAFPVTHDPSPNPPLVVHELASGREVLRIGGGANLHSIQPVFDLGMAILARNGSSALIEFPSGRERVHFGRGVMVSPNWAAKVAAVYGGYKHESEHFSVFDLAGAREIARLRHPGPIMFAQALDDKRVLSSGNGGTVVWDLATRQPVFTLPSMAYYVGTRYIAVSPHTGAPALVRILNAADGREVATLPGRAVMAASSGHVLHAWDHNDEKTGVSIYSLRDLTRIASFPGYNSVWGTAGHISVLVNRNSRRYEVIDVSDGTSLCAGSGVVSAVSTTRAGSALMLTFETGMSTADSQSKVYDVLVKSGAEARALAKATQETALAKSGALTADDRQKAGALFSQGFELFKAGEFKAAELAFKDGLDIDPANGAAHYYLAETYVRLKNEALAHTHYQRAIDFAPSTKEALLARSRLAR